MTDDIRTLTARLAEEPASLAFLELGEALRRRGQLEAAYKVARGGLTRYPGLADAHDLMARILSDQGDLAGAFDAWVDGAAARSDADQRAQGASPSSTSAPATRPRPGAPPARRRSRSRRSDDPPGARPDRRTRGAAPSARRQARPRPRSRAEPAPPSRRRLARQRPGARRGRRAVRRRRWRASAACCWSTRNGLRLGGDLARPERRGGRRSRRRAARRSLAGGRPGHPAARPRAAGTRSRSSRPTDTCSWRRPRRTPCCSPRARPVAADGPRRRCSPSAPRGPRAPGWRRRR